MTLAENIGVKIPEILLPKPTIDHKKWSIIACDQFTSEPEYWEKVAGFVGDAPSTFHLILPEVWLKTPDIDLRIQATQIAMRNYLMDNVFDAYSGMILVERSFGSKTRTGLMLALDLEKYDYHPGSQTLIRATEGTILDRLPPRMRVRRGASLECPHIMVLYDDPNQTVLAEVLKRKDDLPVLYDFDLMEGSGHLLGRLISRKPILDSIFSALATLIEPKAYVSKYGLTDDSAPLLFAVGDGNHSLATAKAIWEELKPYVGPDHPARYALVELVNLHDQALEFEPIHRVLFNAGNDIIAEMFSFFKSDCTFSDVGEMASLARLVNLSGQSRQHFGILQAHGYTLVELSNPRQTLAAGNLQEFLDVYLTEHSGASIDYVHGTETVERLGKMPGNIGFFLPPILKDSFFRTVIVDGALPRKTFSMGKAEEKRFYMECRLISDQV